MENKYIVETDDCRSGVNGTPFTIVLSKDYFTADDIIKSVWGYLPKPKRAYLEWMREVEDLLNIRYNNG